MLKKQEKQKKLEQTEIVRRPKPNEEEMKQDIEEIFGETEEEENPKLDTDEIFKGGDYDSDFDIDLIDFIQEDKDDETNDEDKNDFMGGANNNENPLEQFVDKVEEKEEIVDLPDYKDEDAKLREVEELEGDELHIS